MLIEGSSGFADVGFQFSAGDEHNYASHYLKGKLRE